MTAWTAEELFTMCARNVGKPLQQEEQAHPEGAAFMTAVCGGHRRKSHILISTQEQQPQQPVCAEKKTTKLPETVYIY